MKTEALDHFELGRKETKVEIKDFSRKMVRKRDKMGGKVGRVLYGIITSLGFALEADSTITGHTRGTVFRLPWHE